MASLGRSRASLNFEVGWKETEMERLRLSVLWQPQSDGQTDIFCVSDWWSLDISVASEVARESLPTTKKLTQHDLLASCDNLSLPRSDERARVRASLRMLFSRTAFEMQNSAFSALTRLVLICRNLSSGQCWIAGQRGVVHS